MADKSGRNTYKEKLLRQQKFTKRSGRTPKVLQTVRGNFNDDFLMLAYDILLDEKIPKLDRLSACEPSYLKHIGVKSSEFIAKLRSQMIENTTNILQIINNNTAAPVTPVKEIGPTNGIGTSEIVQHAATSSDLNPCLTNNEQANSPANEAATNEGQ